MIRVTLDCVRPTQSSVIQIIHRNLGLRCFFQFHQNVYLLSLYMHISLNISQGSIKTHLQCGNVIITLL